MVAFGLHFAEMHDIDRAGGQVALACLFGEEGGLLDLPIGVSESLKIKGTAPFVLAVEGDEIELARAADPDGAEVRLLRRDGGKARQQVIADQGGIGRFERLRHRTEVGGQDQGTTQDGDEAGIVGGGFNTQVERQGEGKAVTGLPDAVEDEVAAAAGGLGGFTVQH